MVPSSKVAEAIARQQKQKPTFRVHHSGRFAADGSIEAKMHLHLFPFGRGHPDEKRAVPVSRRECVRYYAMLSARRFAQDKTYLLTTFDRLAVQNMLTQTSITCLRNPQIFYGYDAITSEELGDALMHNELRRRGRAVPDAHPETCASRFLRSVQIGSQSVWGTNAERHAHRKDAFAYQARFGQTALFVTLTSNTDNSVMMAVYGGGVSAATLFERCSSAHRGMRSYRPYLLHVQVCR